jgi:hypothetical protein
MFLVENGFETVANAVTRSIGADHYFFDVVQTLNRKGLIDDEFFNRLAKERPGKARQIQNLKEFWHDEGKASSKPPANTTLSRPPEVVTTEPTAAQHQSSVTPPIPPHVGGLRSMNPSGHPHPDPDIDHGAKGRILGDIGLAMDSLKIHLDRSKRLADAYQQLQRVVDHAGDWMEDSALKDVRDRILRGTERLKGQYEQIWGEVDKMASGIFSVINKILHTRGYFLHPIKPIPSTEDGLLIPSNPSDAAAHIIFVHGLDGDAFGTWSHGSSTPLDSWPFWLAAELRHVKVWSLSYPAASNVRRGQGLALETIARGAINAFKAKGVGSRPLIFVSHSLGGLVVKKIAQLAYKSPKGEFNFISDHLAAIVFLGTPHDGSYFGSLAHAARLLYGSSATIEYLRKNNAVIDELGNWFRQYITDLESELHRKLHVHAHRETMKLKLLGFLKVLVVEPSSANPGIGHAKVFDAAGKNHVTICKCRSREEDVYRETRELVLSVAPPDPGSPQKSPDPRLPEL